jgi:polyhydroxyalkanoate synthesis regulator phasin
MKTKEEKLNKIQENAKQLQNNCHSTIESIIDNANKNITYQDATNTWIFYQLATLTYEVNELNNQITKLTHKNKHFFNT